MKTSINWKSYWQDSQIEEYNLKNQKFAQLVLGTLVIEDIGGIFMMIILSTIAVSQNASGGTLFTEIGFLLLCLVV